jgi:hypothetical protein
MFIQAFRGKVTDAGAARAAMENWQKTMKPNAKGYLGSTAGVTDDGTFIAMARFDSEESARANSDSPEQSAWWEQNMAKAFDGEPTFYDCPTVELFRGGGSDNAGFVQTMIYTPSDRDAVLKMSKEFESFGEGRPDLLGGVMAVGKDGTFIDTNYFASEAEARAGEKQEMPAEMQSVMQRFMELAGTVEYIDLRDPWLDSK